LPVKKLTAAGSYCTVLDTGMRRRIQWMLYRKYPVWEGLALWS